MKHTPLFTVLAVLLFSILPAKAALELKEGDSVFIVGNTFAERIALSGYLDAMIHAANPDKKIVIRSVPNSADEVDDRPRETNVPRMDFYLKRHGADVVAGHFGFLAAAASVDRRDRHQGVGRQLFVKVQVAAQSTCANRQHHIVNGGVFYL